MNNETDMTWLVRLADDLHPDEVDGLEDDIARAHGFERHPALGESEWRKLRVQFIEALGLPDDYLPPGWENS